jgi:hypothetical protein
MRYIVADLEIHPGGERKMTKKEILDKLSIYIPQKKMQERPVERLIKLSEKRDRSVNYLVVDAIVQYLDRQEKENRKGQ